MKNGIGFTLFLLLVLTACTSEPEENPQPPTSIPTPTEYPLTFRPKFLTANYIELDKIEVISLFRSSAGHEYKDEFESCRSMKHYFRPYTNIDWTTVKIFSPLDGKVVKIEDLWIDIGAKDKEEAASLVEIGDPAVLDYAFAELRNDLVVARGFDDRIGAFVVLEAARLLAAMNPKASIYAVATVQEEIGLRGAKTSAFAIDPKVGIAVDVGFATDTPVMESEKKKVGEFSMGKGPIIARGPNINPPLHKLIVQAAKEADIPYQIEGAPRGTGTDANAIQLARAGVATGLICIPNRYMHSPCEIVHLTDLENALKLIAQTVAKIDETTSFLPS